MVHLFTHAVRVLLEELDIDDKQQFTFAVLVLLAGFTVYEIRARHRHGNVFSALFVTLGLSALVFLFTESEAARHWSALTFTVASLAVFAWEFLRRKRLASDDSDAQDDDDAGASAPAGEAS